MGDAEDGTVVFGIEKETSTRKASSDSPRDKAQEDGSVPSQKSQTQDIEDDMEKITVQTGGTSDPQDTEGEEEKDNIQVPIQAVFPDPLRMFGFSIPSALRTAQSSSIQLVQTSVPRLATVTLQMRALEIQIRRAKKHRAKALALDGEKAGLKTGSKEGVAV